jgi:hypothetical protein
MGVGLWGSRRSNDSMSAKTGSGPRNSMCPIGRAQRNRFNEAGDDLIAETEHY